MIQVFRALADPNRLRILGLVRDGPRAAGEIAAHFDVSRPAISQHLRVLAEARLVVEHRQGTRRLYALRAEALGEIREFLSGYWDERLVRLKTVAEGSQKERKRSVRRGRKAPRAGDPD